MTVGRALIPRLVSGAVLAALAVACVLLGAPYFHLFIAVAALVLALEWARLCGEGRLGAAGLVAVAGALATLIPVSAGRPVWSLAVALLAALASGAACVIEGRARAGWLALGVGYIGLPCAAMIWLFSDPKWGQATVLWLIAAVAATDIGAYFVGRAVGGPKLAPRISPNKTWAGLIGGGVAAALVGVGTALWLAAERLWPLVLVSAALAIISQAGDLAESRVKRRFDVKDSGAIMPGHGGLLDRVDGLIVATLVVAAGVWISGESVLAWQ